MVESQTDRTMAAGGRGVVAHLVGLGGGGVVALLVVLVGLEALVIYWYLSPLRCVGSERIN